MKKTKKLVNNIFFLIKEIDQVIKNKPSYEEMLREVRMMNIKIRPIKGDLTNINLYNKKIVELLWSLNKLEGFINDKNLFLKPSEKKILVDFFESLIKKYEREIVKTEIDKNLLSDKLNIIELEIFKEINDKIN